LAKKSPTIILKNVLSDRNSGFFFNALKMHQLKVEQEKTKNYKWDGKIHPSSLSFDMCMEEFLDKLDNHEEWQLHSLNRASGGEGKHWELQQQAMAHPSLLWPKPENVPEDMKDKVEKAWPEVPFLIKFLHKLRLMLSGRVDLLITIREEPVVLDIKTTSVDPKQWPQRLEDYTKWLAAGFDGMPKTTQTLYLRKYFTQVCVYIYGLNASGYYTKKIKKGGLAFLNMLMLNGSVGSRQEFYWDYTDAIERRVYKLLRWAAVYISAKERGKMLPCKFPDCYIHGEAAKKAAEESSNVPSA
jgi:hypothetical protein